MNTKNSYELILSNKELIWLVDLDDTLYQSKSEIMKTIDKRISYFLSYKCRCNLKEAEKIRTLLFSKYKNSFIGAVKEKIITFEEIYEYLTFVHNFDPSENIKINKPVIEMIKRVKGKKYIFSNSIASYIKRILLYLNLESEFEGIFDLEKFGYTFKPDLEPFKIVMKELNISPNNLILLDDSEENLAVGQSLGLRVINTKLLNKTIL